jgi:hypothetical protein
MEGSLDDHDQGIPQFPIGAIAAAMELADEHLPHSWVTWDCPTPYCPCDPPEWCIEVHIPNGSNYDDVVAGFEEIKRIWFRPQSRHAEISIGLAFA